MYARSSLRSGRDWGFAPMEETKAFFRNQATAKKVDILALSAGMGRCPLAIDLTQHYGANAAALEAVDIIKEKKYLPLCVDAPRTARGAAWRDAKLCM